MPFNAGGHTPDQKNTFNGDYNDVQGNQTKDSFNTTIYGVAGRAAVTFGGAFFAYIHNINDDNTWRMVLVFSNRETADEWWRAVSDTSNSHMFKNSIARVTPQFYTHNAKLWNVFNFFTDVKVASVSSKFRGKLFISLEYDRGGRGITIIPSQLIVDRASGDWFTIRSKSNPSCYWWYDEIKGHITVSNAHRSSFKITATDLPDGAIMIGLDDITLTVLNGFVSHSTHGTSVFSVLAVTNTQSAAAKFKFEDIEQGRFVLGDKILLPPASIPARESVDSTALSFPLGYMKNGHVNAGWEIGL